MCYHVDGDLVPASEAAVSVRDRGFAYGDAAVETLRAYGGRCFEWTAHERRLRQTAERLGMADAVPGDCRERVRATLDANDLADARVRLSVTRGVQSGGLTPDPDVDPTVVVVVSELPRGGLAGDRAWDGPATVQTVRTRKPPEAALPADGRTHSRLNGVLARLELQRAATDAHRADEALVRDVNGHLVEGATSNVFFVDDGTLKTPGAAVPLSPGVTREVVLGLAREESFPVETGRHSVADVRDADEAFLTSATWELRPVATVDGIEVGAGAITALLQRLFDELVERRHYGD
ncbi:MAG: aminotransferase class IV [Haloarculaceae archaeon]